MRQLYLVCAVFLLIALIDLPSGYYTFLRILTSIGAIFVIITEFNSDLNSSIISFGLIAIVFNPLIPIYLSNKLIWTIIDIVCSVMFLIKYFNSTSKINSK